MKVKAIIFDMDGTLLDSMKMWENLAKDYLLSEGIEAESNINEIISTMSIDEVSNYFIDYYKVSKSIEEIKKSIDTVKENFYKNEVKRKPYVKDFLKDIKEKNIKMCVATATETNLAKIALNKCGIMEYFEFVISCKDVKESKSSAKVYDESIKKLKVEKREVCVFEDALYAINTTKREGYRVVGVYDESEKNEETIKQKVDIYVKSFKGIGDIFEKDENSFNNSGL